ncbi:hypothetical protein ACFLVU_02285 [Chloroflexota bacterium]
MKTNLKGEMASVIAISWCRQYSVNTDSITWDSAGLEDDRRGYEPGDIYNIIRGQDID